MAGSLDPQNEDQFNRQDFIEPTTRFGEGVSAAFNLASFDTFVIDMAKNDSLEELKSRGGTLIPRDELNKKYPDLSIPFTEDMNDSAAFFIADLQREKAKLSRIINNGPDSAFYNLATFGAQLLPHAMDPIEFGAGIVGGYVLGGTAALAGVSEMAGITLGGGAVKGASVAQRFMIAAADGIVGNALVEPYIANTAETFQEDYTISDSFMSVVGGAIGFAGISTAAGVAISHVKYKINPVDSFASRYGSKINDTFYKSALAQTFLNKSPRLGPLVEHFVTELNRRGDKLRRIVNLETDGTLFAATHDSGVDIGKAKTETFFQDYVDDPNSITLVADSGVANAAATRSINPAVGNVVEMSVPKGSRFVDLNAKMVLDSELKTSLRNVFAGIIDPTFFDRISGKDGLDLVREHIAMDKIPADTFSKIAKEMKGAGYTGYVHDGTEFLGHSLDPAKTYTIFDKGVLTEKSRTEGVRNKVTPEELQKAQGVADEEASYTRDAFYNKEAHGEFKNTPLEEVSESPAEIVKQKEARLEQLKSLEDQGVEGINVEAINKEIEALDKDALLARDVIKAAFSCLSKGG